MMADDKLQQKLVDYVEDAHAMEQNVSRMLDSMITTTDDPEITEMLKHHQEETERHEQRLRERLDALGAGPSTRKQAQSIATALMKGAADQVRGDQAGKNARDGFTTEHMEIAAYQLLERLAERAGDLETAEVARQNRAFLFFLHPAKIGERCDRETDTLFTSADRGGGVDGLCSGVVSGLREG